MKKFLMIVLLCSSPLVAMDDAVAEMQAGLTFGVDFASQALNDGLQGAQKEALVAVYARHWEQWNHAVIGYCDTPDRYDALFTKMAEDSLGAVLLAANGACRAQMERCAGEEATEEDYARVSAAMITAFEQPEFKARILGAVRFGLEANAEVMSQARKKYLQNQADTADVFEGELPFAQGGEE